MVTLTGMILLLRLSNTRMSRIAAPRHAVTSPNDVTVFINNHALAIPTEIPSASGHLTTSVTAALHTNVPEDRFLTEPAAHVCALRGARRWETSALESKYLYYILQTYSFMYFFACSCSRISTKYCNRVTCKDNQLFYCTVKNHKCRCPSCEDASSFDVCRRTK